MKDIFKLNRQGLKALKFISVIVVLQGLGGCTKMSGTFDCPYGKGVGCRSITEVNQMVNDGKLSGLDSEKSTENKAVVAKNASNPQAIALQENAKVYRVKEAHLKVWVAPFEDEQGDFHEDSIIHTVLKSGYWHLSEGV